MKCPVCTGVDLVMTDRQGVEIDYCPRCRGVWLDRGELDKIIERSDRPDSSDDYRRPDDRSMSPREYEEYKRHKRKSFWRELFD